MSIQRAKRALQELLQVKVPREELSAVTNQDERFDWKSFSRFASSKIRQKKKSDKAFSLFDVDDKGLICQQDVERVAGELGEELSPEEVEEMMNEADPSGDGLVDREAFFRIVRRVNLS
jgi:Ca2+-binding EF-hand superfamily protein